MDIKNAVRGWRRRCFAGSASIRLKFAVNSIFILMQATCLCFKMASIENM